MNIQKILDAKGARVATTHADAAVSSIAARMKQERIGVLIIVDETEAIGGIISERDIVHALVSHGPGLGQLKAGDLMTRSVITGVPTDTIRSAMTTMTDRRIRHLPVVDGGRLCGIVSIGDLVKNRLEDLESEASQMRGYISGTIA